MARYDRILKSLWRVAEGFFHYNSPKLERIWMKLCVGPQCTSHKKWGNCLHGFCQTAAKRVLFFFCHQYNMAFGTHILHRLDHVWNNSHESVSRSVHLWEISEFLHSCFASPKKLPLEALFWVGVLITSVQFKRHIFGWRESFQGLVDIPRMCLLDESFDGGYLRAFSQNYVTPLWTGESAAGAAPRLAVRQLEGCIGADSAASYVELGHRASRYTHRVELRSWPASSRPVLCHHDYRTRTPQPADSCLVVWHTTAVLVAMLAPWNAGVHAYMHYHPQQAARCCLGPRCSRCCCWNACGMPIFFLIL